ncbi:MAG: class I SAM-dependent methyltransferase, partial [Cytophagales bacterium]|nr:class I SAM-dependent methyltransferase [Cytophagales bacterium]
QLQKPTGEEGKKTGLWMNERNEAMNRHALQALAAEKGDTILELGMGNGYFVKDILSLDPSITYWGCDFSEEMVSESNTFNKECVDQKRATFVVGDIENLPFETPIFNKVFTVNTVYFWKNPARNLAEIARVLLPGGHIYLSFRPKHMMEKMMVTKYGFTLYSLEDIIHLVSNHGFTVEKSIVNHENHISVGGVELEMGNCVVIARKR